MRSPLNQPIGVLHRIAKRIERPLQRVGVRTIRDLLEYAPVRHDDLRAVTAIRDARIGAMVVVHGRVVTTANRRSVRRRMALTEALVRDGTGSIRCVWFHQPYLAHAYPAGTDVAIAGTVELDAYGVVLRSPVIEVLQQETVHTGRIVPTYPLTAGITQKQLRVSIQAALPFLAAMPETLPADLRMRERLLDRATALRELHFPTSPERLAAARERLAFEEVLAHLARVRSARAELDGARAVRIPKDAEFLVSFIAALPFPLTGAQQRVIGEIIWDMSGRDFQLPTPNSQLLSLVRPMHRLVNGDVGSGKTVVAATAAACVARARHQVAYLAPTDILARQQAAVFLRWCRPHGIRVALWTAAAREVDGEPVPLAALRRCVRTGDASVVIGTHALLTPSVRFAALALAVVDEQHRFGVEQRAALRGKGSDGYLPHLLSMTATPIPRTLALSLLGDLAVSLLDERPAARLPVRSTVVPPDARGAMSRVIRAELDAGRQAFVVCPAIDGEPGAEAAAVTEASERAQRAFSGHAVGVLHGKLRPREAQSVMVAFAARRIAVLVATTVIEVGVDHPNATVIVIEDAERFGLAQLHQLRGRVGRGEFPGMCFLTTKRMDAEAIMRLERVAACRDGFRIAELDLEERGPGAIVGTEQSGRMRFQFASFDAALFARVERAIVAFTPDALAALSTSVVHLE